MDNKPSTKNKLSDLNNHLFGQLERLTASGLTGDNLKIEIERSKAMTVIAQVIVNNAQLVLDAAVASQQHKNIGLSRLLVDKEK